MLGRLRRTTRLDVGLALAFAGASYLVWALVAGASRGLIQEMIRSTVDAQAALPAFTKAVKLFFVDTGFVIDLVGLGWMAMSLVLVGFASRQKISISWAWVSAVCQSCAAALGAVVVARAVSAPLAVTLTLVGAGEEGARTGLAELSRITLGVTVALALAVWITFLFWLLVERARLNRRGPTLTDGLRSNVYR